MTATILLQVIATKVIDRKTESKAADDTGNMINKTTPKILQMVNNVCRIYIFILLY